MADTEVCSPTSALKQPPKLSRKLLSPAKNGQKSHTGDSGATDSTSALSDEPQKSLDYQQYHEEGMLTPIDWYPNTQLLYEQEFFSQARKGSFPSLDIDGSSTRLDQLLSSHSSPHKEFPASPSLLKMKPPRRRSTQPTTPAPLQTEIDQPRRPPATPTAGDAKGVKRSPRTVDKENQAQATANAVVAAGTPPKRLEHDSLDNKDTSSALSLSSSMDLDDGDDEEAVSCSYYPPIWQTDLFTFIFQS